MKKKGLFVLSLAMLLIVAVALSTATFAWFAVSADAKISTLTVQTSASDGLQIGAISGGDASYGTMTLDTDTKLWEGAFEGFGPELSFMTALSGAYGVTGNGMPDTMYTAASRTATSYQAFATNAEWWAANGASLVGDEFFYTDSVATQLASGGGFENGQYIAALEDKETVLTTGNSGGPYYIRFQAYPTIQVTAENAGSYGASDTFYSDYYGVSLADDGTYFNDGVWRGGENDLGSDIAAYTSSTTNNIYVRASSTSYEIETAWNYSANNNALSAGANPEPYYLVAASPNSDYFTLSFAIRTQRGMVGSSTREALADIFLKKLTVTASGGMAAATRVAIIQYTNSSYTAVGEHYYYYIPFSQSQYNSGWDNNGEIETGYRAIGDASAQGAGYAYGDTTAESLSASHVIADATAVYSGGVWNTATFFMIDKNSDWATKQNYLDKQEPEEPITKKMFSLGTFTGANSTLYYQMVIWFEGTDAQCVGDYAGTGMTIDLAFDFYQQWKP